jgi:hypothetical protein
LVVIGLLLLGSYLAYETFYFQAVLIAAFCALYRRSNFATKTQAAWLLVVIVSSLAIVIGMNRYAAHVNASFSKKLPSGWLGLFASNMRTVPKDFIAGTGLHVSESRILLGVFAISAIALVAIAWADRGGRRLAARSASLIALGVLALPVFCAVYALAGYQITAVGNSGRTMMGISWALSVVFLGMVAAVAWSRIILLRLLVIAAGGTLICVNCLALQARTKEWASVWAQEKEILTRAPVEEIRALPPNSRLLYLGPFYYHDIVVFGAYWEITGAVFSLPALRSGRRAYAGLKTIYPALPIYNFSWDGSTLIEDNPGYWTQTFAVKRLFIWNYDEGRVYEAEKGFRYTPVNIGR